MKILIVEDEAAIAQGLVFNFEQEGYEVVHHADGPSALKYFDAHPNDIDLVVLDLMLPGMSGYEICGALRDRDAYIPIMVLSARTLTEDKSRAFDLGVDQYVTKPFALPELLSRVRRLLDRYRLHRRRQPEYSDDQVDVGRARINFRTFELRVNGETHQLTTMELQLLKYFIANDGAVLARSQILRDVWEQDAEVSTRTVDNFVMRLRRYLEQDPSQPRHLLSVRGTGYRFLSRPDDATHSPATA